jgi:glutamate-1-semialdehyde 2,1-aminomutase
MAAGLASLKLLDPLSYVRLNAMGDRLRRRVDEGIAAGGAEAQITGTGSLFRVHLTRRPITGYRSSYPTPAERDGIARLRDVLRSDGFLVTPNVSGAISTPTTEAEIDGFADAIVTGIERVGRATP